MKKHADLCTLFYCIFGKYKPNVIRSASQLARTHFANNELICSTLCIGWTPARNNERTIDRR